MTKTITLVIVTAVLLTQFYSFLWLLVNYANDIGAVHGLSGLLTGVLITSLTRG